jgi:hypothetical protein
MEYMKIEIHNPNNYLYTIRIPKGCSSRGGVNNTYLQLEEMFSFKANRAAAPCHAMLAGIYGK